MRILEELDPEKEICIEVSQISNNKKLEITYDIGFDKNEFDELV